MKKNKFVINGIPRDFDDDENYSREELFDKHKEMMKDSMEEWNEGIDEMLEASRRIGLELYHSRYSRQNNEINKVKKKTLN